MDLARRPFLHTMASGKKRDAFNAQSLGVNLNPKVKEVRKLHPSQSLNNLPRHASPWSTGKYQRSS
jgi:hypothetical protein